MLCSAVLANPPLLPLSLSLGSDSHPISMARAGGRVSAASARSHTRKKQRSSPFSLPSGIYKSLLMVICAGIFAWAYASLVPPSPKICGSPNGPPITAPRIKLKDGRHLAYKEHGVSKESAKYVIIYIHGFDSCRHSVPPFSMEVAKELGVYMLSFDRPGYGESDPNPRRSEKSIALDVEELADQMELGPVFHVIGFSMGGQAVWGCLKYIPHRLAGALLIAPVINFWWPGFPANMSKEAYHQQLVPDQWAVRVSHYLPWLTYWWNTQKWFPSSSVAAKKPEIFSPADKEILRKAKARANYQAYIMQQGEFESLHRDLMVGFGTWEFDPMRLNQPFPSSDGSVHLWQGDDDLLVPVLLQRYIAEKLPWIHYHELPGAGHLFCMADGMADKMVKTFLLG